MAYRVSSPGWSGGGSLGPGTACVVLTQSAAASLPFGWASASAAGSVFTFKDAGGNVLGNVTLALTTLASVIVGATVLINTGLGAGWNKGVVVSDGTVASYGGILSPSIPLTTRAATGLSFTPPVQPPGVSQPPIYSLAGTASDGTPYFSDGGVNTFTSAPLTTLGAVAAGALCLIEVSKAPSQWQAIFA